MNGEHDAERDERFDRCYRRLRAAAAARLASVPGGSTVQPTMIVHEAWLRMAAGAGAPPARDTEHFMATAAQAMQWIVVDLARRGSAERRGGDRRREPLEAAESREDRAADRPDSRSRTVGTIPISGGREIDVIELDSALGALRANDPRAADVISLRTFGGLSVEEVGRVLRISTRTVKRAWHYGRAWLLCHLDASPGPEPAT